MAERPIFIPDPESSKLVKEVCLNFTWHPGLAPSQKKKNIISLHDAAAKNNIQPLLEVSTKSPDVLGQHLSAFNLHIDTHRYGRLPLETAFQGSKVFERGGPFTDLYGKEPRDARGDLRLKESGALTGFKFENIWFPLQPKTVFYDWLYLSALFKHRDWLERHILRFAGFTDIEFNPERSINCQARSCALLVSLLSQHQLDAVGESPSAFLEFILRQDYKPERRQTAFQASSAK